MLKKILNITLYIVQIISVLVIIYFFINYRIYIVASGSMEPTLKINELIVVKKSDANTDYLVGDIITYYDSEIDIDVTHRIIEIDGNNFYTKGDYNNVRDLNTVSKELIIGKVVYNSYFLGYLYTNYRFYILILLIIAIVTINLFFKDPRKRGDKNKKDYK